MAKTDEAQQAIITSCVNAMEGFPLHQETLGRMVLDASASYPDPTATPESTRTKSGGSPVASRSQP